MNKKLKFWLLFVAYTLFALIIPIGFIIWRYDLFKVVSSTTIGVWGLICIVILVAFASTVIKYLTKGAPYSYSTQVITGILKSVLPFALIGIFAYKLKDTIDLFIQVMCVISVSELVAVLVNPFPKWMEEHNIEKTTGLIDYILDRKKGEK